MKQIEEEILVPSGRVAKSIFSDYWKNTPAKFRDVSFSKIDKIVKRNIKLAIPPLHGEYPKGLFLIGIPGTGKTSILYLIKKKMAFNIAVNHPSFSALFSEVENYPHGTEYSTLNINEKDRILSEQLISSHYMSRNMNVIIVSHFELTKELRDFGIQNENHSQTWLYDKTKVLMVDDLGRGYDDQSGWNLALQDEYFDWRWQHNLPTYITTNKTPTELRSWKGWERIIDRLVDPSWTVSLEIGGESKRKSNE